MIAIENANYETLLQILFKASVTILLLASRLPIINHMKMVKVAVETRLLEKEVAIQTTMLTTILKIKFQMFSSAQGCPT